MRILLISGSPNISSRSTRLADSFGEQLAGFGYDLVKLTLRELPAQALLLSNISQPELAAALELVRNADAIVISTPVYKAAYSGLLKVFLDALPQDGLQGKLVQPLATGGSQSHMLMLDYALAPVLSALSARQVLPGIYATDLQIQTTEHGLTQLELNLANRIYNGATLLAQSLIPSPAFRETS